MRRLVRKLHIYAGLLSFTAFVVYGIAGIRATLIEAPDDRRPNPSDVREIVFDVPGDLSDKALADRIHAELDLPLTRPIPEWALYRDEERNLVLDFYTANGIRRVTVLEAEGRLRVEAEQAPLGQFLNQLHATVGVGGPPTVTAWALYNIFSTFCLLFMTVSGVYLWLATRPGHGLALVSFAAGSAAFLALVWLIW